MSSTVSYKQGNPLLRWTVRELSKPERIIGIILLALLVFFVLMPAVNLVLTSFSYSLSDRRLPEVIDRGIKVVPGQFTLVHLERVFFSKLTSKMFLIPLMNSAIVTLGLTVVSMIIGCILAYLVVRTNLPFKKAIANVAMVPYIIPSWPIALAWLTLFKNSKTGGTAG